MFKCIKQSYNIDKMKVSPLLWKWKTIHQVCKLAKTAETRACENAMEDSVYLARCIYKIYTGYR